MIVKQQANQILKTEEPSLLVVVFIYFTLHHSHFFTRTRGRVETYLRYVVTNVTDELRDLSKSGARTVTVVDSTTVLLPRISREV